MITKNEEEFIEQCLNSVKDIADEIVIVDTGSTDKTIELAKKVKPDITKIIRNPWNNDFSEARNVSLKNATKEWVLYLDADETLSKQDTEQIKELIKNKKNTGYILTQRNYTDDPSSPRWLPSKGDDYEESKQFKGWVPSYIIRLFQNKKEIRFTGEVHESVRPAIEKLDGSVAGTTINIHHYGKVRGDSKLRSKWKLYDRIGEKKVQTKADAKSFLELGIQKKELGKTQEAIDNFKKALEIDPKYIRAYIDLTSALIKANKIDEAIEFVKKGLDVKKDSNLFYNFGLCLEKKDQPAQAAIAYDKAIQQNPKNLHPYFSLAKLFLAIKNIPKAELMFKRVFQIDPRNEHALKNLKALRELKK